MYKSSRGWLNGLIGVIIFSGSLPATRVAVAGFTPEFLTVARAAIAGLLALLVLKILKEKWPKRTHVSSLVIVSLGVVIGFPLCTALALQYISASYSIVFIALLPLSTAIFGVIRSEQCPQPLFWLFALLGSSGVMGFMLLKVQGENTMSGNLWMLAAITVCGLGYAEGGKLSRQLGGWQVISWALVISLPLMLILSYVYLPQSFSQITISELLALLYVAFFSMFFGFIFWYQGLAQGGVLAVGQLQLLQPFLGLGLSAWLLNETVSPIMWGISLMVVICVAGAKKFSVYPSSTNSINNVKQS